MDFVIERPWGAAVHGVEVVLPLPVQGLQQDASLEVAEPRVARGRVFPGDGIAGESDTETNGGHHEPGI